MEIAEFDAIKTLAVFSSIALASVLQGFWPHSARWRGLVQNWRVNYAIAIINAIIVGTLTRAWLPAVIAGAARADLGFFYMFAIPFWLQVVLTVAILDLVAYLWHIANHYSKFLWRFHAVHHSDQLLDASTAFRFHLGEILISLILRILVVWIFGMPLLGVMIFEVWFVLSNTLVHSDINVNVKLERTLGRVFITPAIHRKHHSLELNELNSNFGTIFSFWDRLLRTWRHSSSKEKFAVGLRDVGKQNSERVLYLLQAPWL